MGNEVSEANLTVVASQLYDVLRNFDLMKLKEKLKDDPELYIATLKEVSRVAQPTLQARKYRDLVAELRRLQRAVMGEPEPF